MTNDIFQKISKALTPHLKTVAKHVLSIVDSVPIHILAFMDSIMLIRVTTVTMTFDIDTTTQD